MEQIREQLTPILRRYGMLPEDVDLITMTNLFLGQMRIGFYGGASSIPMRPTYLTPSGSWALQEPVAVAEVNEREIRTALVTFTEQGPEVTLGECFPVPGVEYPAPFEDLIFAVVTLLEPLLEKSRHIALCLPFPLEQSEEGDATILKFPSSMRISDWEGTRICALLSDELNSRGITDKHILPVNTVSAVLLSGKAMHPKGNRYLSLTWGNGVNSCISVPKSAILKLKSGENQLMLLDCGSGGLTGVPFSGIDLIMDRDSQFPGKDLLDKMVSIESLGELYRFTMIKAVEAGLLTFMCGREFLSLQKLSLSSVEAFLSEPDGDNLLANFCCKDEKDQTVALLIARAVLARAARLVSANLAAILLLTGAGQSKESPALVSLSGEAFTYPMLNAIFQETVDDFITGTLQLHCQLHYAPNSVLTGGAIAALLNP